ncbi:hypothetical protein TNCV_782271 [Trichonephila clavipes]|nr:hypothetical protein TNCV_782271 [Trichonephila clavipes]
MYFYTERTRNSRPALQYLRNRPLRERRLDGSGRHQVGWPNTPLCFYKRPCAVGTGMRSWGPIFVFSWPTRSPDLIPTKHAWKGLGRAISTHNPLQGLKTEFVIIDWEVIGQGSVIEIHELGFSLSTSLAISVGHNVSTIQRCPTRWNQEGLHERQRGIGVHKCTSEHADLRIHQLPIQELLSIAHEIRSPFLPGAVRSVFNKTLRSRLYEVQLRARVPATMVPLTVQHRARRLAWCHRLRTWTMEWYRAEVGIKLIANDQ